MRLKGAIGTVLARASYANVMATIAVFVALGGGAYAITLKKNSVKARQIAKGAVGASELKNGAVNGTETADNSLTGSDINEATLVLSSFLANFIEIGDAAEGDLSGTYPDPTIASGAVGPSNFGNIPAVRATEPTEQVVVTCNPSQTINSGGGNVPLLLGDEDFDTTNMHAEAVEGGGGCDLTDTSKLIASRDGIWAVEAGVVWPADADGSRFLVIQKNATSNVASSRVPATPTGQTRQSVAGLVRLDSDDYVEAVVATTDSLILDGTSNDIFLSMHWVAPG